MQRHHHLFNALLVLGTVLYCMYTMYNRQIKPALNWWLIITCLVSQFISCTAWVFMSPVYEVYIRIFRSCLIESTMWLQLQSYYCEMQFWWWCLQIITLIGNKSWRLNASLSCAAWNWSINTFFSNSTSRRKKRRVIIHPELCFILIPHSFWSSYFSHRERESKIIATVVSNIISV